MGIQVCLDSTFLGHVSIWHLRYKEIHKKYLEEHSEYYLIKPDELVKIQSLLGRHSIIDNKASKKWLIIVVDTEETHIHEYVKFAIYFKNHKGNGWGFDFYHRRRWVCGVLDSKEESYRAGNFKKMASLLELKTNAVEKLFNSEHPEAKFFAKIMGFEIIRSNAFLLKNPPIM